MVVNIKDSDYIKKRDKLIPIAEKIAERKVQKAHKYTSIERAEIFNKIFHNEMNRLAMEAGITNRQIQFSIRIPEFLHAQFKSLCASKKNSMGSVIKEMIENFCEGD